MTRPHGTRKRYIHGPDINNQPGKGCRCQPCCAANTKQQKVYRLAVQRRQSKLMVDAAPARAHVLKLHAAGMGNCAIERLSGVHREQIRRLAADPNHGRPPVQRILATNARALLAVQPGRLPQEGMVPSIGSSRRLQGLTTVGWPIYLLAEHTGLSRQFLRHLMSTNPPRRLNATTVETIATTAAKLEGVNPLTAGAYPRDGTAARNRAQARDWLPLAAWDDDLIDLPEDVLLVELRQRVARMDAAELARCNRARQVLGERSPLIVEASREYKRQRNAAAREVAA